VIPRRPTVSSRKTGARAAKGQNGQLRAKLPSAPSVCWPCEPGDEVKKASSHKAVRAGGYDESHPHSRAVKSIKARSAHGRQWPTAQGSQEFWCSRQTARL